jgi:hypothetical protein
MSLTSNWVTAAATITTEDVLSDSFYTINIPPVRRRGQRESTKENIEAAEIATIAAIVEQTLDSLTGIIDVYKDALPTYIDAMNNHLEAAKAKTETK